MVLRVYESAVLRAEKQIDNLSRVSFYELLGVRNVVVDLRREIGTFSQKCILPWGLGFSSWSLPQEL